MKSVKPVQDDLFQGLKDSLLNLDPVAWAEANLTLDGKPFRLHGNGYKPFADIYRNIGLSAWNKSAKPIIIAKGRQIGATTMAAIISLYFTASGVFGKSGRPPIRIAHVFPYLELSARYSKVKLAALMNASKTIPNIKKPGSFISIVDSKLDTTNPANNSLQFKQFEGGSHIFIESTGLDGTRLKGATFDILLADEVQLIRGPAIGNVTKSLTTAQYGKVGEGIQLYFGTPLQKGSEFHRMWLSSSQNYYHMGCEQCGQDFPLYAPGVDWETVWVKDDLPKDHPDHGFLVKCIHCGLEQNKLQAAERGKWVNYNKGESKFNGYHLNQLYIPFFDRDKIISEKPENSPVNSPRIFANEVMGEFYSGDSSPITTDEIDNLCADYGRQFSKSIHKTENQRVYLGIDWGLKVDAEHLAEDDPRRNQGQSYTCMTVVKTDGIDILSIEYTTRLKKNDLDYKVQMVDQLTRQFSVDLICADIGFGHDIANVLAKEHGDKFLVSESVNRVNGYAKFTDTFFPHRIVFEKDYYLAQLFEMMKKGKVRFPYGNYEHISWLIAHCSSMDMRGVTDRAGSTTGIRYVKGSSPNDGLMSLLNAMLCHKHFITRGFSTHHPANMISPGAAKGIPAILAHIPIFGRR